MEIKIEKLKIVHFKGIKSLEVTFGDVTNISGENGTGKTSIMDAFLWLLFGKDSSDRKEFEIKPISLNGNGGPKDVEVEGTLLVEGKKIILKRVYREKWQKKRGALTSEFTGHESTFFVNEVPCTLKEYNEKIALIVNEDTFKMLTNPAYFPSLKWQTQREILFQMAGGELPDTLIAEGKPEFKDLIEELEGKTLDEYKRQIANHKRRLRESIEHIPSRIDEVHRSTPEAQDWKELEASIKNSEKELKKIEDAITDKSKAYEKAYEQRQKLQDELYEANHKLRDIIEKARSERENDFRKEEDKNREVEDQIRKLSRESENLTESIDDLTVKINTNTVTRNNLREDWIKLNSSKPEDNKCPTCGQVLDFDIVEFNTNKAEKLASIGQSGQNLKAACDKMEGDIKKMQEQRESIHNSIAELKKKIKTPIKPIFEEDLIPGVTETKKIITSLEEKYNTPITQVDVSELKEEKQTILEVISEKKKALSDKELIEKSEARISELEKQQKTLSQEMADLERIEFTIQKFEKVKVEAIEDKVNSMFSMVKWRLYETQVNGQEVPCCVATYNKVPYSDLNNAARINTGIDIINALSEFHGVKAPVWIDNSESINEIKNPTGQLTRLVVTRDPKLVITLN